MNNVQTSTDQSQECRRLKEKMERDGGTAALSATELAFLQAVCHVGGDDLSQPQDVIFGSAPAIDNSGGGAGTGTIMDDPDAGRPDDPDDANPAAPDPAITKE